MSVLLKSRFEVFWTEVGGIYSLQYVDRASALYLGSYRCDKGVGWYFESPGGETFRVDLPWAAEIESALVSYCELEVE